MGQWYDSRLGCERSRVQFPAVPRLQTEKIWFLVERQQTLSNLQYLLNSQKKTNENGQKLNILFFCKTSRNASMLEQGTVVLSYDS